MKTISEIEVTPVKPQQGLVAFASFVLYGGIYCCSVAVFTRPDGGYRLVYPTKKVGFKELHIFHPVDRRVGKLIEEEVTKKLNEVMNHDRYSHTDNTRSAFYNT